MFIRVNKEGRICLKERTWKEGYVYKSEQGRKNMFIRENKEGRICL